MFFKKNIFLVKQWKQENIAYTWVHARETCVDHLIFLILVILNQTGREGLSILGGFELECTLDVLKKMNAESSIYIGNTLTPPSPRFCEFLLWYAVALTAAIVSNITHLNFSTEAVLSSFARVILLFYFSLLF